MVNAYGNALRKLWTGLCDVYIRETTTNPANGRDEPTEVQILHAEPCRVSYSSVTSTSEIDEAAIQQVVKLFISNDAQIPAGSKIVITQAGRTATYSKSGMPAVYSSHQEIMLVPFKRWA